MMNRKLIVGLVATVVAGTALGKLDRIVYVSGSGWQTELIQAGNFLDVADDKTGAASGALYMSKAGGGMARSYESGGGWVNNSTLSGMGSGTYTSIDGIHHVSNDQILMDSSGISRGYYSSGWKNDAIVSGSFSKISQGSGYMGYALPTTGTGAIRYYNGGTWLSDSMGSVSANTYTAVFGDRDAQNDVLLGGANGLERTHYSGSWQNTTLTTIAVGNAIGRDGTVDTTYIAKAGGGLMRVVGATTFLDDMGAAGSSVYVDIVGYGQANALFMLTEDGDIERGYYSAGAWHNEVIATGDYTAIAEGNEAHEVFAIPEPATLGTVIFAGGGLLWIRRMFMV